jgi:Type ISP C-terminal specificity domain
VYFTPQEVVGAQVRLVEEVLRERLSCGRGFGDERVLIVDPACGTGAYPLAILERAPEAAARMRLFEALARPGAIARDRGLTIIEGDALAVNDVSDGADVVAIIGNPPYRRRTRSATLNLDDFVADAAGVHRKNLHNEYVYFWRWALRVAFEARRGPAIVCFVTAASYLRGPAFSGMRRALRRALDELWLIDLEGDQRAARSSANVFPIRTPVAIALGVRYGDGCALAPGVVHYTRIEGDTASKLSVLSRLGAAGDLAWQTVASGWHDPLHAVSRSQYWRWPALTELFPWQLSGAQLKRTWPIGVTPEVLRARWRHLLALPEVERRAAFGPTRDRDLDWSPPDLLDAETRLLPLAGLGRDADCPEPVRYAYRAFDRHWVLPDARLGDFMRPRLWRTAGPRQVFLTSMLTNVLGPGPAVVATRCVPDLDHFRGSFGARGVIPLWLDAGGSRPNACEAWFDRLSERYGRGVSAPELLAYCYAVLSAPSYTRRFAEELRTPGPRVPLTHDHLTFRRGVTLGEELLAIHTYQRVTPGRARVTREVGARYPSTYQYNTPQEQLVLGEACVGPVSQDTWAYAVSGYRVVNGWLRRRVQRRGKSLLDAIAPAQWDAGLTGELLELLWLVEATLAMGPALDALLERAVIGEAGVKPA